MKITPLDIKKQEFETRIRGFDKAEVISFLEMISEEMENLIRENLELKEKLQRAKEKLGDYTKIETALQNTLVATQESADQMKDSAREKADLIIREANIKAEKIVENNPPNIPIETYQVADHLLTTFEGAFILAKIMDEPKLASEQLIQCRNYIELLFSKA